MKRLELKRVSKLDFVSKKCIRMINFDTVDNRNGVFCGVFASERCNDFQNTGCVYTCTKGYQKQ